MGLGVNKAWGFFSQRFDDLADFIDRPHKERMKYLESLAETSEKLAERDPKIALGFDLFKMWLVAVMQKDKELGDKVTEMLEWLSKKAPHV